MFKVQTNTDHGDPPRTVETAALDLRLYRFCTNGARLTPPTPPTHQHKNDVKLQIQKGKKKKIKNIC